MSVCMRDQYLNGQFRVNYVREKNAITVRYRKPEVYSTYPSSSPTLTPHSLLGRSNWPRHITHSMQTQSYMPCRPHDILIMYGFWSTGWIRSRAIVVVFRRPEIPSSSSLVYYSRRFGRDLNHIFLLGDGIGIHKVIKARLRLVAERGWGTKYPCMSYIR